MRRLTRNAGESEKSIERYLVRMVASAGGKCLKYYNAMERGYPDRIVLLRSGESVWVEVKSRGKRPTALQELRMKELWDMGQKVAVVSSRGDVDELLGHFADESAGDFADKSAHTGQIWADRLTNSDDSSDSSDSSDNSDRDAI